MMYETVGEGWGYVDFTPNFANSEEGRKEMLQHLQNAFDRNKDGIVDRMSQLPILVLKFCGEYVSLLVQARQLFMEGYFYGCVAMSGIVAERIFKDLVREHVLVRLGDDEVKKPEPAAFDKLERVDLSSIIEFLFASGLVKRMHRTL